MKSIQLYPLIIATLFLWGNTLVFAMSTPRGTAEISLTGTLSSSCIPTRGGTVFLQVGIDATGYPLPERSSRPMNVAVVLDRSGSMDEERKIEFARQSVISLIDQLSSADYLSIVIYDNVIETLVPTQRVRDKAHLKSLVREVYPRGATNLGGGMMEGFRQVEQMISEEMINRVILLSDGLANKGVTDPLELNRIARKYRSRGVSLTTMGMGLDYNENLMVGLAEAGGGNYYFIESPRQLASIFEREVRSLTYVVAQNARIAITSGKGVRITDVIGYEWHREGNQISIDVGDIYANDHRELTIELAVPAGEGRRNIAKGKLLSRSTLHRTPEFSVDARYSDDVAELDRGRNWDVQGKVDVAVSTRQVERAMKALDEGRREEAAQIIGSTARELAGSEAAAHSQASAPLIQQQLESLRTYENDVNDEKNDSKRVKKSIQYRNYQTQKKIEPEER